MENNKKKKYLYIGIIIILITISIVLGIYTSKNNRTINNNDCVDCVVEKDDKRLNLFNIKYSGETKEYNAYDFIIEKMSQAQYWTYDQYEPIYNTVENHYEPSKDHVINNATGWVLYDEETASFARGYEGRLIINFADNTALSHSNFYVPDYDNSAFSLLNDPVQNDYDFYDLNTGTYYSMLSDGTKYGEKTASAEYEYLSDAYNEINRTIQFYDKIFNEAGIPLLHMPKGTLESYKNKIINIPIELIDLKYYDRDQDELIHSPFDERVGWKWHWEEDEDNIWLDDYRDVFNQQFPNSTENEMIEVTDIDGSIVTENEYAPVFLCLTNKKWSDLYETADMLTGEEYYNFAGAFETYYLKPLYKQIFGFNGLYFYDESKIEIFDTNEKHYGMGYRSLETFNKEFKLGTNELGEIIKIYDKGDTPIGSNEQLILFGYGFVNTINTMNRLCKHYEIESIFGKDFPTQLSLLYDCRTQRNLGLR